MAAPTFSPFTTLGVGNGFRACLNKVDVSVYEAYNPMTLEQACNLYWLLWGISGEASATDGVETIEINEVNIDNDKIGGPSNYEPKDRLCNGTVVTARDTDINGGDSLIADIQLYAKRGAVRMYDGVTTDEANFIGYGIAQRLALVNATVEDGGDIGYSEIQLYSYADGDAGAFIEVGNVTISGIPFVASIECREDATLGTIDFTTVTATATVGSSTATARIDSLDLYSVA